MLKSEIKADISDSTNSVLKELALPASRQIGQAMGNIFGLLNTATLPAKLTNEYAQRNFQKFSERLSEIPEDKIKSVEPEIGIPIIEKLSYTSNEELANAYANLLANASNIDRVDCIHPGFVNKLNNMAPDEVKLLEKLKTNPLIYYIYFRARNKEHTQSHTLTYNLTGIEYEFELDAKTLETHFNNLVSLHILEDKRGIYKIDKDGYEKISALYSNLQLEHEKKAKNGEYNEHIEISLEKSYYELTPLGETFIEACTK